MLEEMASLRMYFFTIPEIPESQNILALVEVQLPQALA